MENIQQAAKPSAMMNEAPMNHLTLSDRLKSYKRTPGSFLVMLLVVLSAVATIAALVFLILYILVNGIPYINADLFSWTYTSENCSVIPAAINTVIMAGISLLLAVPVRNRLRDLSCRVCKKGNKLVKVIRVTAETLTGIPSIVYGLFGMLFFVTALKMEVLHSCRCIYFSNYDSSSYLRTTEEALLSVPDSYREGSFGLGAGKLRTIFKIVLPAAVPGILSGVILATGRIVGETAALIYTAGTVAKIPNSAFSSGRTLAVHMYLLANEGLHVNQAYATAVILLILVIGINALSSFIAKKISKA